MAYKKTQKDPFEVKLNAEKEADLIGFLTRELEAAELARSLLVGDNAAIDLTHLRYQGGKRLTTDGPWKGAANLGSFIVTEKVDALRARIMSTLFTEPIWVVEGFGEAAAKSPTVEKFMQWKAEVGRVQQYVGRAIHNSLIEGTGVLEVADRVVLRKGVRKIRALVQQDANTGQVVLQEGEMIPVRKANMDYVEAGDTEPGIDMFVKTAVRASEGPSFRVHSLKNFFMLPGHAVEKADIWGYAKRFHRRLSDLKCQEREGFYKNVDDLGTQGERQETPQETARGQAVPSQRDETAEMEIWEVTLLADLDDDGYEEWYLVTLSVTHGVILRVQYEDYNTPHYVLFRPFPRTDSVYGFSFADDKLGSLYDEHEAVRNMFADRSRLATSAPFMRVVGSTWNPALKPFGPKQVIDVRDLNELKQLDIKDVPNSVTAWLGNTLSAAERLSGMNDVTTGVQAQQDRTLGEVKLVAEQSWIRIDEAVKNIDEGLEELFDIILIIWQHKLAEEPEQLPGDLLRTMEGLGQDIPEGTMTADMIRGAFRGKPKGSVEASDLSKMRGDVTQLLQALVQLSQAMPAIAGHLNQPQVVRSIMAQIARVYRWPDPFNLVETMQDQPMPGMPGMPPDPNQPQPPGAPGGDPNAILQAILARAGGGKPGPGAGGPAGPAPVGRVAQVRPAR